MNAIGRTSLALCIALAPLLGASAQVQLQAQSAGAEVLCAPPDVVARTQQQWIGDGRTPEGVDEWPALLRQVQRSDPDFLGERHPDGR